MEAATGRPAGRPPSGMRRPGLAVRSPAKRRVRPAEPAGRRHCWTTKTKRQYCRPLVPPHGRRSDRNALEQAISAAESRIARNRSASALRANGPGLEAARVAELADLPLRFLTLPTRPPVRMQQPPPPPGQRRPPSILHQSPQPQGQRPIEARQAHARPTAPPNPQHSAEPQKEGNLPSRPPRGPTADRPAVFPLMSRSTGLANRPGTTLPG